MSKKSDPVAELIEALDNDDEMTTRAMCDHIRAALAKLDAAKLGGA